MATGKFVSYLRVSTDKQGRSGLGIEAQRDAVARFLASSSGKLVQEYIETESGKRSDRPKLTAALAHAKATGATVVFAKRARCRAGDFKERFSKASGRVERSICTSNMDGPPAVRITNLPC